MHPGSAPDPRQIRYISRYQKSPVISNSGGPAMELLITRVHYTRISPPQRKFKGRLSSRRKANPHQEFTCSSGKYVNLAQFENPKKENNITLNRWKLKICTGGKTNFDSRSSINRNFSLKCNKNMIPNVGLEPPLLCRFLRNTDLPCPLPCKSQSSTCAVEAADGVGDVDLCCDPMDRRSHSYLVVRKTLPILSSFISFADLM